MDFAEWVRWKEKKGEDISKPVSYGNASENKRLSTEEWSKAVRSVQNWGSVADDLRKEAEDYYSTWQRGDNGLLNRIDDMVLMADGWRKQYAGDDETIQYIDYVVAYLGQCGKYVRERDDHYGQWDSADEYSEAVKQAEADKVRWAALSGGFDFEKNHQEGKAGWEAYMAKTQQSAGDGKQAEQDTPWWEKMLSYLGTAGPDTSLPIWIDQNEIAEGYQAKEMRMLEPAPDWTKEQKYTFGYLWSTDKNKARTYAYAVNNMRNTQKEQIELQRIQEWATDSFGAGVGHTIGAIAAAPLGISDWMGDMLAYGALGYIPEYDGQVTPFEYSQAVTGGIGQHLNTQFGTLDEDIPVIGGKGWGDVYGLGTSIAQSTLAAFSGGQGQALISFFGSASAAGVDDALKRGASGGQAAAYGSMVGLAEALAEMIGVDNLLKIGTSATGRQLVSNILKQGAAEGIEEGVTAVLNNFADNLIMADKSNFNLLVSELVSQGLGEEDAKRKAWMAIAGDVAFDMLGGFASGGVHSAPLTTLSYAMTQGQYANKGKTILAADGGVEALRSLAEQVAGASSEDMRQTLGRQSEKVGKKATARGVGRLYEAVQTVNNQANTLANQADIVKSLTRKGIDTKKAESIAEALVATYNGQELTKTQTRLLKSVKDNEAVQNAMTGIVRNVKSTMGQRSQNIRDFREGVATNSFVNAAESDTNEAQTAAVREGDSGAVGAQEGSEGASGGTGARAVRFAKGNNGKLAVQTSDGSAVDVDQAEFGSEDEAVVYHTVAKLATNAPAANLMLSTYEGSDVPAQVFAKGIEEAYVYGSVGIPLEQAMKRGSFIGELTEHQAKTGYKLGKLFSGKQTGKEQAAVRRSKDAKPADTSKGEVHFEGDRSELNKTQKASLDAMELMAKSLGVQIYVFESEVGADGKHQGVNGWYDPGDGSIHIDLYAGADGKGVMLFTVAHELTHFIRQWSPAKFKVLANFLMKQYGQKGISVQELVENQMAKAKRNGRELTFKEAYEEVVADSMEAMLTDGNVIQGMAELKQQDKGLWQKIRDWFKDLAGKLKAVVDSYKDVQPDSTEGKLVADMQDVIGILESLYQDALVDASENYNAAGAQKNTTADSGAGNDIAIKRSERIVDQIRKSLDKIMALDTVYEIDANNATPFTSDRKTDEKSGHEVFKGQGGVANRPGFGRVVLSKRGAVHTVHHGNGPAKQASFPAIKAVIEKGVEIYRDIDHEGRGYDTVTFSAPIDFFGNPSPLATVVKVFEGANADKTFYIHEICDAEGNYIQFPEEGAEQKNSSTNFVEPTSTVSAADNGIAPENSIHNLDEIVNSDSSAVHNQMRGETLTDWDVLEQAAQMLEEQKRYRAKNPDGKTDLTSLEKERAELQERLAKQKELGEDTVQIRKQIKDVDGRIRAAQNNLQLTDGQRYALDVFNQRLERIKELRTQKTEVKQLLDEQKANGASPSELAQSKRRIDNLNRMIREQTNELLEISNKAVLKQVLGKARTVVENKLKQEHEAQLEAVRQDYRKKADAKIADIKQKYQESRGRSVEGRKKTELRRKIRKTIRELSKLLEHGTKERNVKQGMREFASKAIASAETLFSDDVSNEDLIRNGIGADMGDDEEKLVQQCVDLMKQIDGMSGYDTLQQREALERKLKSNLSALRPVLERERKRINKAPVDAAFNGLAEAYKALEESDHAYIRNAFDDATYQYLRSMGETLQGSIIKDMSTEQLETLHKAYTLVLTKIRNANKGFVDGRAIDVTAKQLLREMESGTLPKSERGALVRNLANKMGWDYEKLYYALDRIGSETLTRLFNNLADSENIVMADVQEAKAFLLDMVEKYGYNDWPVNQKLDREFVDNTGKKFRLTLGEIMSLYAYSRRADAWDHFEVGGFVFSKTKPKDINPAATYKLTKEQCEGITGLLTKEQRSFAEKMQKFLSETMGGKGNEVSMQMYGIEMFGEENYFPIHTSGDFKPAADEERAKDAAGFASMSNAGFTKARQKGSVSPVMLDGFLEVWVDHVNEMSRYHGTVPALEDIRRVMNYSSYVFAESDSTSVKAAMKNHFGKEAVQYFDALYREANSGAVFDKLQKKQKWLLSRFRKNSVAYSLSVLVQQPASLSRAFAVIDKRHFNGFFHIPGLRGVGALPKGIGKMLSNHWTKAFSDNYNEMLKYAPGVTLAKEIGGFDTATGGSIRSYLLDTGKGLRSSFKTEPVAGKVKAVAELVDDNPVANLPNAADKLAWVAIWEACKHETVGLHPDLRPGSPEFLKIAGQRFTEVIRATQVYDSIFAKSPLLRSKNIGVQFAVSFMNEPNTTANMVEAAIRSFSKGERVKGSKLATAALRSVVFACVTKSIVYALRDDDEEETYLEKYIEAFTGSLLSDITIFNYIPFSRDIWSAAQGYDVERPDMVIVGDFMAIVGRLAKLHDTDTSEMSKAQLEEHEQKITEAWWKLLDSTAAIFGVPVKNVRREINAVLDHAEIASRNSGKFSWRGIRDAIEQGIADASPVFAKPDVESYAEKFYEALINGDQNYVDRHTGGFKGKGSFYYFKAITSGSKDAASKVYRYLVQQKENSGMTTDEAEKSIKSGLKTQCRDHYEDGKISGDDAVELLVEYCGVDKEDANADVAYWQYKLDHPDADTYAQWFDIYFEKIEDSGIELDTFLEYRTQRSGLTKRDEILDVIDALPISDDQKDALYFAEGYAESTLHKAPWR